MGTDPGQSSTPDILSGVLLADLRRDAEMRQLEVAAALAEVSQAQLSRIEQWRAIPSPATTRALLELYATRVPSRLSRSRIDALVDQAEALQTEHVDARVVLQAGRAHNFQLRTRQAEARAAVVRSYHPTTILGVLQTRAFANAWFTPSSYVTTISTADAQASVEERMRRWDALSEPGREWRLIQTEQALRWPVRDYALQADQLEQMIRASLLPNVRLRIIRLDTLAPEPAPLTGFHVYDEREAVVGTDLGTALVGTRSRVDGYLSRFALLETLALSPDDSRDLLTALSRDYRART